MKVTSKPVAPGSSLVRSVYTDAEYPKLKVDVRRWTWEQLRINAEGPLLRGERVQGAYNSSSSRGSEFAGCEPAEAIRRMRDGWAEGVGKLSAALDSIAPQTTDGQQQAMDVNGFHVCIGAYVAGDPECMFNFQEQPDAQPVISFVFQTSYSHGVSVQNTVNYAAALTSLVGELDARGVTTALYGMSAHHTDNRDGQVSQLDLTPVREPGAPLDLSKVAFAMSAPMHRRIHFATWESLEIDPLMNAGPYGYNCDIADGRAQFAREIVYAEYPGAIFLPWIGTLTRMGKREMTAQEFLDAMRASVVASGFRF